LNANTSNSVSVANNTVTLNSNNPVVNIQSSGTGNTLNLTNLNISYALFSDNYYYTIFPGSINTLNIQSATITFSEFNFIMPFTYSFALPLSNYYSPSGFTNVANKFEHMDGTLTSNNPYVLYIDTITFDFSKTIKSPLINIELFCSGYNTIHINNLILVFGNNILDQLDFNIELTKSALIQSSIFTVSNITLIGKLTSKVFFTKSVLGLNTVYYSSNIKVNNNWALIVPLTQSNGYYSLPSNYQSLLDNAVSTNPKLAAALNISPPTSSSSNNQSMYLIIGIIIGVIILLGVLAFVYFKFIKKDK
jgi:hypothetical protein